MTSRAVCLLVLIGSCCLVSARYYDYYAMREGHGDAREMARERMQLQAMLRMFGFGSMGSSMGGGTMGGGRRRATQPSFFSGFGGGNFGGFGGYWGGEAMYDA